MACAAATLSAGMAVASCGGSTQKSDVSFVEDEVEKKGPQFLEGALSHIYVNDRIVLDEYVDYVEDVDFTLTMTDENGNVEDITKKRIWYTRESGTYTMTYTIKKGKHKGTSTFTLYVTYPELWWEFSLKNMPYKYGETLEFEKYFEAMNIYTSLPNCETKMESVEVGGETIDLSGETSYTFASRSDHTFRFFAESPDGQRCEGTEIISIKYIDEAYQQELEDMGISLYGDLYVERGNFTLVEGSYCNGNNVIYERKNGPHNLPYLAYNGDYGIGDYVKIEINCRKPIMKVFGNDGESYCIDSEGNIIEGIQRALFLPVASGNIDRESVSGNVTKVANAINGSRFWSALIEQIYLNEKGEFILIPRVGNHTIELGTADNVDTKLQKLHTFYTEAMGTVGWNKYSKINIEFNDKIVCTKREKK